MTNDMRLRELCWDKDSSTEENIEINMAPEVRIRCGYCDRLLQKTWRFSWFKAFTDLNNKKGKHVTEDDNIIFYCDTKCRDAARIFNEHLEIYYRKLDRSGELASSLAERRRVLDIAINGGPLARYLDRVLTNHFGDGGKDKAIRSVLGLEKGSTQATNLHTIPDDKDISTQFHDG
jgi:hypothetical protein